MSALGVTDDRYRSLTYFPENPCYYLNVNASDFDDVYAELIVRVSYLAKVKSKISGDGERNFGCSQS
ncbi:YagK/YfjJ domain-containing protein [Limnobaculum parvum]